jgi:hypothetical protein
MILEVQKGDFKIFWLKAIQDSVPQNCGINAEKP